MRNYLVYFVTSDRNLLLFGSTRLSGVLPQKGGERRERGREGRRKEEKEGRKKRLRKILREQVT